MTLSAKDLLQFLDVEGVTLANVQRELSTRLSALYDCGVRVGLACPLTEVDSSITLSLYSSTSGIAEVITIESLDLLSRTPSFPFSRLIQHPEFSEGLPDTPLTLVQLDRDIGAEGILELELAVSEFFRKIVDAICGDVRAHLIRAKVNSTELGSFLHRLIAEQKINDVVASEYVSVFARDWVGNLLRLRGTNGSLRSSRRARDVAFHCTDVSVRLVRSHQEGIPTVEFSERGDLNVSGVSHETDRAWARVYWPIRLGKKTTAKIHRIPTHSNDGIIRLTNCVSSEESHLPYTWLHMAVIAFLAEGLYNIIDSFAAADEASFKRDEAFHNSMSVVDTIAKNLETVADTIYNPSRTPNPLRPPRFKLTPLGSESRVSAEWIFRLLRTAYASARDLGFQIIMANDELPYDRKGVTERLISDVILNALDLVPDMCFAHSALEGYSLPTPGSLLNSAAGAPPPVRGAPEALISVFANVFENSVKYRKPDERVRLEIGTKTDSLAVWVSVRDHGVGVRAGEEERIFNRGYRGQNAHEYAPRGSGLGLSWCEKVLALYGGSVTAHRQDSGLEILIKLARAHDHR